MTPGPPVEPTPTPDQPEGEPVTDEPMVERLADPYLARIDDRINWRLTHVNLPIADVKYLFSTIAALQEEVNEANERAHHNHVSRTALLSQLREQRERAELAEIERDTAQAQVRAKQSWIDGMKVDYDALNDEANDHAHAAAIAEDRASRAEGWEGEKASMKEAFQRERDQRLAAEAALRECEREARIGNGHGIPKMVARYFDQEDK